MAATMEQNPVDIGVDQRREVAGDEEDAPETRRGRAGCARARSFEKISKFWPGGKYSLTLSVSQSGTTRWHRDALLQAVFATRCDRKVQIGCTKIENLDQLSDLSGTEMEESLDRESQRSFGSLSL